MAINLNKENKFVCENCGAELKIKEATNNCVKNAVVYGKNDGHGTIVVPTVNGKGAAADLLAAAKDNPELMGLIVNVADKIKDGGYLDVKNIVRRWIPAQCLRMLYSKDGFHSQINNVSYKYSWKVLIDDLKRQRVMIRKGDIDGFKDRNRWYNQELAVYMADSYINELLTYMNNAPVYNHRGRSYIKLRCQLNHGLGVHIDEFDRIKTALNIKRDDIEEAETIDELVKAVKEFDKVRKSIHWNPEHVDDAFVNVYKAAGAYYTMKDMILFENCKMKTFKNGEVLVSGHNIDSETRRFIDREDSLDALEDAANLIVERDVKCFGYQLLGVLKDFLKYNHFDFQHTIEKWKDSSETRRAARRAYHKRRY